MEKNKSSCSICPRKCNIDRSQKKGFCGMGIKPVVAKAFLHKWEEPCISGSAGSGTVFFSGCSLKCVYCQNAPISQENFGKEITLDELSNIFISLQDKGAHNINLVNPTHFVVPIRQSIINARNKGLNIPIVYNSNGYETLEALKEMEGIVNVYLPDIKYYTSQASQTYSKAAGYFEAAALAVNEMYKQVGTPVLNENGILTKGLIIRHLILPGHSSESIEILNWIKQSFPSNHIFVSLMSQYIPYYKAELYPEINRRIIRKEYDKVVNHFLKLGFEHGYIQERESAKEDYIPAFDLEGVL
ncbi:MAG: radical SAM protein [Clostridia bacterium]|nr:radical SAM protein [Clostridia bacterium]